MHQPEDLFHRIRHILAGIGRIHGLLQGDDTAQDGEKGVDAMLVALDRIRRHTAGKGKDGLAVLLCDLCHADGRLAHDGLAVQAAFTGDDHIRVLDVRFQLRLIEDDVDAGFQHCVGKAQKGKAETARRAGARCVLVNRADTECESYADAAFATMRDLYESFAANEPIVPWEYHAAGWFGLQSLEAMYRRTIFFDTELNAVSLARVEELASRGLGTLCTAGEREVTARELAQTPALAPFWLKRPLCEALSALLAPRYPLLTIKNSTDGEPLSSIIKPH